MSHRHQAHAARRRTCLLRPIDVNEFAGEWTAAHVTPEWDMTTYDDVIPHRLRGTLRLDDDGEPASLVDLIADRSLS